VPDDATVIAMSHRVIEAYDRGDAAAVTAALGRGFVRFEGGAPSDGAAMLKELAAREPGAAYMASRAWRDERVRRDGAQLVFVGRAHEVQGGNDVHGGYRFDGWYLLAWAPEGGEWKLRLWTWQRARAPRDGWNDIYADGVGFTHEPNQLLVDAVRGVTPGEALDLATGQGRNALYLARQGWRVTGVDIADEGLRQARAAAVADALPATFVEADLASWELGVARWDLIAMIYTPAEPGWYARIDRALKPGGLIVIDGWGRGPGGEGDGEPAGAMAARFPGYEILVDRVERGVPDWAQDQGWLARFVARKR